MEQHLRSDHRGLIQGGPRLGKRLAPYGLTAPGGLWLVVFFVVPMAAMFVLSLETPIASTGFQQTGYRLTWNFAQYPAAVAQYHTQFLRSLWYATVVTAATMAVGYPAAYWIATWGGRQKTTYLFLLLLPFFVSFVIRTLAWQFILSDDGIVLRTLERWHLVSANTHILATPEAVIAGIAYNALPFMVLPIYVSLEKIDRQVIDASRDLYARPRDTFLRVILPLSVPGLFAGFLLTFIPAVGDYVNAEILGGVNTTMIGNVIQRAYLNDQNYPLASALSFVLMVALLGGIALYGRMLGTRQIEEYL
jgi:spermidine/putrescine transport system permease protein